MLGEIIFRNPKSGKCFYFRLLCPIVLIFEDTVLNIDFV